jgi:hypothetical protein
MFRLVPLFVTATAVSDETSLMQGVKPQHVLKEEKSKSVSNLLETAKTMLKNGATPDVVTFAQSTLEEITSAVLPKIEDSHSADQQLVTETHAMFAEALADFNTGKADIARLQAIEDGHRDDHKECRGLLTDSMETCEHKELCGTTEGAQNGWETWSAENCATEHCACEIKRDCDYELWSIWKHFAWEETVLREKSREIENHFCVEGANGTVWTFRDHAVTQFPPWIAQKTVVEGWEAHYGEWMPTCQTRYLTMDATTAHCDAIQQTLEEASCTLANKVSEVRNRFAEHWQYASDTYQRLIEEVHCLEIDRWKEWRSLKTVECLLESTARRNGRPCEESTDEFYQESSECEHTQVTENIDHLRINYPRLPDPDPLPPVPPLPCTAAYDEAMHYNLLWQPPEDPFHAPAEIATSHFGGDVRDFFGASGTELQTLRDTGNSHCNERPDCVPCIIVDPVPACASMAAHYANNQPWVRIVEPDDECRAIRLDGTESTVIEHGDVTRRQYDEGQFDGNDDGHFNRGGTHQGPTMEDPLANMQD